MNKRQRKKLEKKKYCNNSLCGGLTLTKNSIKLQLNEEKLAEIILAFKKRGLWDQPMFYYKDLKSPNLSNIKIKLKDNESIFSSNPEK